MGASTSSLRQIENDYELVVRVSKELDRTLEKDYRATQRDLGQKIEAVEQIFTDSTIGRMKHLVYLRNQLVHNYDINYLRDLNTDRADFLKLYDRVRDELVRNKRVSSRSFTNSSSSMDAATRGHQAQDQEMEGWAVLGIGQAVAGAEGLLAVSAAVDSHERDRRRRGSRR